MFFRSEIARSGRRRDSGRAGGVEQGVLGGSRGRIVETEGVWIRHLSAAAGMSQSPVMKVPGLFFKQAGLTLGERRN
jgi:hypothetical protein